MNLRLSLLLGCALTGLFSGRSLGDDVTTEQDKLRGKWTSISYETSGAAKDSRHAKLVFDGNDVTITVDDETRPFVCELDLETFPKSIDIMPTNGQVANERRRDKGVYMLQGDTLTICFGGRDRPTKFAVRPNTQDSLIVLNRTR